MRAPPRRFSAAARSGSLT